MSAMNRLWNVKNPHQGAFKKVLCVCSAGLLRSPTVAWILSNPPYNFNTRAVGLDEGHALIPLDEVHLQWADAVVFVEDELFHACNKKYPNGPIGDQVYYVLGIPDIYGYRDPELVRIIKQQIAETDLHPPMMIPAG